MKDNLVFVLEFMLTLDQCKILVSTKSFKSEGNADLKLFNLFILYA